MDLAIDAAEVIRLEEANLRMRQELLRLQPFWGPGMTKQQAIAAYEAATAELK